MFFVGNSFSNWKRLFLLTKGKRWYYYQYIETIRSEHGIL